MSMICTPGAGAAQGVVFNFQNFSIHDGPGIRTTMFVKGCPLHCPWCSNPESIDPSIQIKRAPEKCGGCLKCVEVCNTGALYRDNGKVSFDHARCSDCLACLDACSSGGIAGIGFLVSVEEAISRLMKDKPFYENTGGGVTISGGEPLLQYEFVSAIFEELHANGVHTALDTSGFAPWDVMEKVIRHVDLVLFDIKHIDGVIHRAVVGVDNSVILDNVRRCAELTNIWIRTPLIPGFNSDFAVTDAILELGRQVGARRYYFLPFHRWGEHKYERLGLKNTSSAFCELSPEETAIWKDHYRDLADFVFFEKP